MSERTERIARALEKHLNQWGLQGMREVMDANGTLDEAWEAVFSVLAGTPKGAGEGR